METILAEAQFYRPRLVVFVTGQFRYGCVNRVLQRLAGAMEGEGWTKEEDWSSPQRAGAPAVLWTAHPQGKPSGWVSPRIARARELLAG